MKKVMMEFEVSMRPSIWALLNILMIINWKTENVAHSTFFTRIEERFWKDFNITKHQLFFVLEIVLFEACLEVGGNSLRHVCEIMSVEQQAKKWAKFLAEAGFVCCKVPAAAAMQRPG